LHDKIKYPSENPQQLIEFPATKIFGIYSPQPAENAQPLPHPPIFTPRFASSYFTIGNFTQSRIKKKTPGSHEKTPGSRIKNCVIYVLCRLGVYESLKGIKIASPSVCEKYNGAWLVLYVIRASGKAVKISNK